MSNQPKIYRILAGSVPYVVGFIAGFAVALQFFCQ